jgi:hypothetical protein
MKKSRTSLLALCALMICSLAQATTVIEPTFDELVSRAEVIFQGTVTDVRSQWTGEGAQRHIETYVTARVDDALKGEVGATYTLRILGGTVGDMTMEVTDTPKFIIGDRDILFVENNGAQFIPLVGIGHGRFRVERNGGDGDSILTDHGDAIRDLSKLGKEDSGLTTGASPAMPLRALGSVDFKAAIRAKLGSAAR